MKDKIKRLLTANRRKTLRGMIDYVKFYRYLNTWKYQIRNFFLSSLSSQEIDTSNKKVSIIVPTLSKGVQADHLFKLRKLLSVYLPNQSHKNYEVIVWCDGPNKMVESMVASIDDERIKLRSTNNTIGKWGHPQTRLGIRIGEGDFFVRINDDNIPYPDYLQSLVSAFDCATGIVYGRVIYKGEAKKVHSSSLISSFVIPGDKGGELKLKNIDCFCYMVRMDLAKMHVQYFSDQYAADWFFLEALLESGVKAKFIDRIIGKKL